MRAAGLLTSLTLIMKMAIIRLLFTSFWFFCSSKRALHSPMLIKVAIVGCKERGLRVNQVGWKLLSWQPGTLFPHCFFRMQSICFAFEICLQKPDMYV